MTEIIGHSPVSQAIREFIMKVASYDEPILLVGETGVGKEVIARKIHELSLRKEAPFVPVDCAAIPETIAESELFGHKKGAFTDAREDRIGLIEAAHGGTVFLDEIAECSLSLQAKLLRAIEYRQIRRVGEASLRPVDVRFILATNRNLKKEIKRGQFRQDLYFRISSLEFNIPPLRERREDIPDFVAHFLSELNKQYGQNKTLTPGAMEKLLSYDFPGNIRELEKILTRAFIFSKTDEIRANDIKLKEEEEEEEEVAMRLFREMTVQGKSFWEVVYRPFIKRDLKRSEVRKIIRLGLQQTLGSYKKLLSLFNLSDTEKEYKKFIKFLSFHRLGTLI